MQGPTTLRGIFPDRKVAYRKNFIKENVRKIRQIQEMMRQENSVSKLVTNERNSVASKPPAAFASKPDVAAKSHEDVPPLHSPMKPKRIGVQKLEIKPNKKDQETANKASEREEKITHRSMQTENSDNIQSIYATGVIKYPTPSILPGKSKNQKKKKDHGHGDSINNIEDRLNDKDYIKENMLVRPGRTTRRDPQIDPNKAPPNYKRGVVPKYIKQKKENLSEDEADVDCPMGHVLLPEEERKETLRVLRESYADKIQELNVMPVRSDTLRMQKRKMELEEDLKKIDEGIKVFQRPKVFVKINV